MGWITAALLSRALVGMQTEPRRMNSNHIGSEKELSAVSFGVPSFDYCPDSFRPIFEFRTDARLDLTKWFANWSQTIADPIQFRSCPIPSVRLVAKGTLPERGPRSISIIMCMRQKIEVIVESKSSRTPYVCSRQHSVPLGRVATCIRSELALRPSSPRSVQQNQQHQGIKSKCLSTKWIHATPPPSLFTIL
jgi:hypothetical protein